MRKANRGAKTKPTTLGLILGIALLCLAPEAKANTYLFSFTGQNVLDSLLTAHQSQSGSFTGTTIWKRSAIFGIWVEPNQGTVSTYNYLDSSSPNPLDASPWESGIISDPSDLPSSRSYVGYRTIQNSTSVKVMSGWNGGLGGTNIFVNSQFDDTDTSPLGWGTTTATITGILNPASIFHFTLETPYVLPGTVTLNGQASELRSSSTSSFVEDKVYPMQFSLQATVTTATPEPGGLTLAALGGAMLGAGYILKKKRLGRLKKG